MELFLLLLQEGLEGLFQLGAHHWEQRQEPHGPCQQGLVEGNNNKHFLDVHLDDGLANQCGTKEGPEWNQEVPTGDASQIKQWVGNLKQTPSNYERLSLSYILY